MESVADRILQGPSVRPGREAWRRVEDGLLVVAMALATLLPLVEAGGRALGGFHIRGSATYVQHVTLWLTFLAGLLATREGKHLTLSTTVALGEGRLRHAADLLAGSVSAAVVAALCWASVELVRAEREMGEVLPHGLPQWVSECVMPVALGLMAIRFALGASPRWKGRLVAVLAVVAAFSLDLLPERLVPWVWPLAVGVAGAALVGVPVFVAMGGVAMLLFFRQATPIGAVPAEIYRLITSPTLPAIPLLTAAGYILAEGRSSARLVRLFRALFGSLPGGIAVMVAAVCALFTTFTGGSGVTIIALGGLVYPMLRKANYPAGFSLGLVTASGSLGLLFPPSLPVILYSVVAQVPADDLYLAGLAPGLLLVVLVAAWGVRIGLTTDEERVPFSAREAVRAVWDAKWELSLPVLIIALFTTGFASIVEASAAACAYAAIISCVVTRDLRPAELARVVVRSSALIGAVLILLSVAMGLTSYLVDAQIPDALLAEVQARIDSPWVFLLTLNAILLVLGSVLEIYSAIIVLVPIIAPMAAAFGIDPVHLGIVFLANLELGFLFPPVGLNLFLSSARFGEPLPALYRHVVPFLLILGAGVLLITYLPVMSLGVLEMVGKR